jgi:leader peptidase (prepilin peptidase)/N-methyltransferase
VTQVDENAPIILTLGKQELSWTDDLFNRPSDRLVITCPELRLNDLTWQNVTAEFWLDKIKVHGGNGNAEEIHADDWKVVEGTATKMVIPREAMGFGDALLLMMIGAFCGWKAVLFTIFAASVLGTLFAGLWRAVGKAEWSSKIPFGPYLAAGAVMWVFWGPQAVTWYWLKATGGVNLTALGAP